MGAGGATEVSAEYFADQGRVPTTIWGGQGGKGASAAPTYLEKGGPAAALGRLRILLCGVGHVVECVSVCVQDSAGLDALEVSPWFLVYAAECLPAV